MQKCAIWVGEPLVRYKLSRVALGTRMSHFVIKLLHFVTPVSVQPCLVDRMQDFSVHAGDKYLPKSQKSFWVQPGRWEDFHFKKKKTRNNKWRKTYMMVTLKSNNHCISALCNLVGSTYLMVTLKSNNHYISAFCDLVGRTYLMVTLKSNNHCILALCNLVGRIYLMVTLNSNNHCIFSL